MRATTCFIKILHLVFTLIALSSLFYFYYNIQVFTLLHSYVKSVRDNYDASFDAPLLAKSSLKPKGDEKIVQLDDEGRVHRLDHKVGEYTAAAAASHAPHHAVDDPQAKYLIADLRGGLTNQAMEIFGSVLIAEKLNRTLVLPQVKAILPKGMIYGDNTATQRPIEYIWNTTYFIECAKNKLNRPDLVFATDARHYQIQMSKEHSYDLFKKVGKDTGAALLIGHSPESPYKHELLKHLASDNATYVSIINPFAYAAAHKWKYSDCFAPSERIQHMVEQYKTTLPASYSCLHARTEADWFSCACCDERGNTTSLNPEEWSCPIRANGTVSKACFMTPRQIAQKLSDKLEPDSVLWVSSGSSREALQPLYDSFNVYAKEKDDDSFMDYGLAEVDKLVCGGAAQFWGMGGSTFSGEVASTVRKNGGTAVMYARKVWS